MSKILLGLVLGVATLVLVSEAKAGVPAALPAAAK